MSFTVQKPQFDPSAIKVGDPINVKRSGVYGTTTALVVEVSPLSLRLLFVKAVHGPGSRGEEHAMTVTSDEVARGSIELARLIPAAAETKTEEPRF